jgi:hypothetical protein
LAWNNVDLKEEDDKKKKKSSSEGGDKSDFDCMTSFELFTKCCSTRNKVAAATTTAEGAELNDNSNKNKGNYSPPNPDKE